MDDTHFRHAGASLQNLPSWSLMPSPIGHALTGLAIGLAAEPATARPAAWTRRTISTFAGLAAAAAALPDADLVYPLWHRAVTHSIGANVTVMIIAAVVTRWVTGAVRWRWVLILGA